MAPMAGYTNGACRRIFRESGGADGCVSEFVYCRAVLSEAARVFEKMAFDDAERPFGIQIFGSDPREMADAASLIEERLSPDFIDVNFGCPAPNAVGAGAGSALLRDVPRMSKIVSAMAGALKKTPVTAKMRSGWSLGEIAVPPRRARIAGRGRQDDHPPRAHEVAGVFGRCGLGFDRAHRPQPFDSAHRQRVGGKAFRPAVCAAARARAL